MKTLQWDKIQQEAIAKLREKATSSQEALLLNAVDRALFLKLELIKKSILLDRQRLAKGSSVNKTKPFASINSVLLKPVSDLCNLKCTYCYEGIGNQRNEHQKMSLLTLERIVEQILSNSYGQLLFGWHGGEPLLAGLNFFKRGILLQENFNINKCQIINTVQTNGVLLNQTWINFFKENNFSIGLSLDGSSFQHDKYRIDHSGKGTFDKVISSIKMLQKSNMPFGIISTISSYNKGDAKSLFDTFIKLGISQFHVQPNFGYNFKNNIAPLHPKLYANFVIELFECWLKEGNSSINITLFNNIIETFVLGTPGTCYLAGSCNRIIAFESNGDAIPCTRPFNKEESTFGNILSNSLIDICSSDKYKAFYWRDLESQKNSMHCPWYTMCHNGCPSHRIEKDDRNIDGSSYYCSCQSGIEGGYSAIFSYIYDNVKTILFKT